MATPQSVPRRAAPRSSDRLDRDRQAAPQVFERLRGMTVLCVYGQDEKESLCRLADTSAVHVERRPGRHHFDGNYDAIAAEILRLLAPLGATSR